MKFSFSFLYWTILNIKFNSHIYYGYIDIFTTQIYSYFLLLLSDTKKEWFKVLDMKNTGQGLC